MSLITIKDQITGRTQRTTVAAYQSLFLALKTPDGSQRWVAVKEDEALFQSQKVELAPDQGTVEAEITKSPAKRGRKKKEDHQQSETQD